jgi:hypothetical protein
MEEASTKGCESALHLLSLDREGLNKIFRQGDYLNAGEVTSPISPMDYCWFTTRYPLANELYLKNAPDFIEAEDNHFVACHLVR